MINARRTKVDRSGQDHTRQPATNYSSLKKQFHQACDTFKERLEGLASRQQKQQLCAILEHLRYCDEQQSGTSSATRPNTESVSDTALGYLAQRLDAIAQHQAQANEEAYRQLCIEAEILLQHESPAEDQERRMRHQMEKLSQQFGAPEQQSTLEGVHDLLSRWCQQPPCDSEHYPALAQRFNQLLLNAL